MTAVFLLTLAPALAADVDRVPQDFPTIQAAVDGGSAPVIQVAAGRWAGAMVTRNVVIQGASGAVIDRGVKVRPGVRAAFGLDGGATGAEVRGFQVDCTGNRLDLGVFASVPRLGSAPDNVVVADNAFVQCVQGVTNAGTPTRGCTDAVDGGAYWVVESNTFDGFATRSDAGMQGGGIGVLMFNAQAADVIGNRFRGTVDDTAAFTTTGVALSGCQDCTVAANDFAVKGGEHWWVAVANLGYTQRGGAPTNGLILSDNDASRDSAPWLGVSYRSQNSNDVDIRDNAGTAFVDHDRCGDGAVGVVE